MGILHTLLNDAKLCSESHIIYLVVLGLDDISWIWRKQHTMSTKRKSLSSMVVLLLLVNSLESASFQRCQPVPKYLDKLYRRLTIRRKYSGLKKGGSFNSSGEWKYKPVLQPHVSAQFS